jgi:hypothetical protein
MNCFPLATSVRGLFESCAKETRSVKRVSLARLFNRVPVNSFIRPGVSLVIDANLHKCLDTRGVPTFVLEY